MKIKRQDDIKDCGPRIVQALHNHFYTKWVDINEIKIKTNYGPMGVNIKNLLSLLNEYGIKGEPYNVDCDSLFNNLKKDYFIALINSNGMNHYVIVKIIKNKFKIFDSIKGSYKLKKIEFQKIFQQSVILIEKSKYKPNKIDITHPMKYLSKNYNFITWIVSSLLISIIFTFVSSLFMKIILDRIIPGKLTSLLKIICISFAMLAILRTTNKAIRSYLVKKLTLQIEKDLTFTYFEKINSVSCMNLSKITLNDNLRRIGLISHVSGFISNSFFVILNESIMFLISSSIMIWISPNLFSITLLSGGLISIVTVIFRLMSKQTYDNIVEKQMKLFDAMVDTVNQTKELKNPILRELNQKQFEDKWVNAKNNEFSIFKFSSYQNLLEMAIEFIAPILIIYIGVGKIFNDKLTIGSLLMFVSIFNSFISPIRDLCDFFFKLPQMQRNFDLIGLIINLKNEPLNVKGIKVKKINNIEIKNATIGYDRNILEIDHMLISNSIKLIGGNGTGKTTFINLINTSLEPKGKIFYNNFEREYYSLESLREKIITLSPNTYIPNMSVIEYITLNNQNAIKTFHENIEKYNLLGLLKSINLSMDMPLINNGKNISSGQRQIVILLRLFAYKFDLIILDEAFENIDRKKLVGIGMALREFQNAIFVEVSHSKRYISDGKEVSIESINQYS